MYSSVFYAVITIFFVVKQSSRPSPIELLLLYVETIPFSEEPPNETSAQLGDYRSQTSRRLRLWVYI